MEIERKSDFVLPKLDDYFTTQEQRDEDKLSKIREIPLTEIDSFPEHPYQVKEDEDMFQLIESITQRGVITPATVRKKEDGRYELISGHRRKRACELAGYETLRCEVVELTNEEATILMVESNFQRTHILPSEKAFAFKMRLDAMNRQGHRSDLTSSPVATKLGTGRSDKELAQQVGESKDNIRRFIRLTYLVSELLEFVDEGNIKIRPAVELSYLEEDYQRDIVDEIDRTQAFPSHAQAIRLRKLQNEGKLNTAVIETIMSEKKPNQAEKIVLQGNSIRKFIPENIPITKTEEYICKALEYYQKHLREQAREHGAR